MACCKRSLKKDIISSQEKISDDHDVFRDSWVRYLGYTNEVGESFRSLVPVRVVHLSYGVASCYVVADAVHKGQAELKHASNNNENKTKKVAIATADCLLWQGLASVAIPGFTINRICKLVGMALKSRTALSGPVRHWTTTLIGLMCIPFIIKPIDNSVEYGMNHTVRKLYTTSASKHHNYKCDQSS